MMSVANHPRSLAELCSDTGLPRATVHRLATALESHRILARTSDGRWSIGSALATLGAGAKNKLIDAATPVMAALMNRTGESVQLYQASDTTRTCIAAQEPASGLQNTVPVGSQMRLTAGSAAKVFLAHSSTELREALLPDASFTGADLERVRGQGWSESVSEREVGLASLSAPVFNSAELFLAVLSISGPAERLGPEPGARWSAELTDAAGRLSHAL